MFRFAHIEYLYCLYLIPAFILVFWYLLRNKSRLLEKFAVKKLHTILFPAYSRNKSIVRFGIIISAIIFLIIAAAVSTGWNKG